MRRTSTPAASWSSRLWPQDPRRSPDVPRLSDARPPAAPSSEGQKDRHQRMLRAAVKLGSRQDFERVQMQDIAAESEVAIATLYRYFPSKVHLFVGVMRNELEKVDPAMFAVHDGQDL